MLKAVGFFFALLVLLTLVVEVVLPIAALAFGKDLPFFWFTRSFLPQPEEESSLNDELDRLDGIMNRDDDRF